MADDDQDLELDLEEEAEEGGGNKKLFVIIGLAAILLVGAGIAAFLIFSGDDSADTAVDGEETVEEVKEPAQYVKLPEPITTSIAGTKGNRTIQVRMSFVVRGDEARDAVQMHMPQLKNDLLMLVSQQNAEDVKTPEGRKKLQELSLEQVQATMIELVEKPTVEKVLFVSFVMQ